jgi:hypothetical protein
MKKKMKRRSSADLFDPAEQLEKMNKLLNPLGDVQRLMQQADAASRLLEHERKVQSIADNAMSAARQFEKLTEQSSLNAMSRSAAAAKLAEPSNSLKALSEASLSAAFAAANPIPELAKINSIAEQVRQMTAMENLSSRDFMKALDLGKQYSDVLSTVRLSKTLQASRPLKAAQVFEQVNALSAIAQEMLDQEQYRALFEEQELPRIRKTIKSAKGLRQKLAGLTPAKRYLIYYLIVVLMKFYVEDIQRAAPGSPERLALQALYILIIIVQTSRALAGESRKG